MKYRRLGRTELKVSVIGLGTHQFSGEWAKEFQALEVTSLLSKAQELGINFLDTAECYGDHAVEALLGQAIAGNRTDWIVATKFGHSFPDGSKKIEAWSAAQVQSQLEASLKALETDYIDLYQFHSGCNEAFDNEELWAMLNNQLAGGKIRFLGVSLAAERLYKKDLHQVFAAEQIGAQVIQTVYNRLNQQAEDQLLPFCKQHQLGVLARVPLAKGFLSGSYHPGTTFPPNDTRSLYSKEFNDEQLRLVEQIKAREVPPGQNMAQWALAWCLRRPEVSSVVVGCKNLQQLELNAGAAELIAV